MNIRAIWRLTRAQHFGTKALGLLKAALIGALAAGKNCVPNDLPGMNTSDSNLLSQTRLDVSDVLLCGEPILTRKVTATLHPGKMIYNIQHTLGTEDVVVQTRISGRIREGGVSIGARTWFGWHLAELLTKHLMS